MTQTWNTFDGGVFFWKRASRFLAGLKFCITERTHGICEVPVIALEGPEMLYYLKQHTVTLRAVDQSTIPFWNFLAKISST